MLSKLLRGSKEQSDTINRLVVRAPNWLGDAVMSVPALRELRRVFPAARMTLVSRSTSAEIFIGADFIDDILIYDRRGLSEAWNQIRDWRQRQFDLAVLFQNAFEAAVIAFLARIPIRVGYQTDRRGALLTHSIHLPEWKDERHETFYYLNIVREVKRLVCNPSATENADPCFALEVSNERQRQAVELLSKHGVRRDAPLVLLCPGSINSRAKRWPAERYAVLADRFVESGAQVALIGSPAEMDVSEEVCRRARNIPIALTGKTSVAEAASIISVADILITNDTGSAHVGSAVGTPTLVIFGPTNPLTTRPFASTAEVIRQPPDCAPCMLRDCPIDHRCMTAIWPDEVFARASAIMLRQHSEVSA